MKSWHPPFFHPSARLKSRAVALVPVFTLLLLLLIPNSRAQNATVVHSFEAIIPSRGAPLGGLVRGDDGNFYGVTAPSAYYPTTVSTVYKLTPDGVLTTLQSFDDSTPATGISKGRDGNFYGVISPSSATAGAGPYTLYRLTPGGVLTLLGPISGQPTSSPIQGHDGNLYGTTASVVYKVTLEGALTVLHDFEPDSTTVSSNVVEAGDGNLYGVTRPFSDGYPQRFAGGTVFRLTPGGTLTTLHQFGGLPDGDPPNSLVVGQDDALYGPSDSGGDGVGAVFYRIGLDGTASVAAVFNIGSGGSISLSYRFDPPYVQDGDGNFYGAAASNYKTISIYQIAPDGTVTSVESFSGGPRYDSYSIRPIEPVAFGEDGNLYLIADDNRFRRLVLGASSTLLASLNTHNHEGANPQFALLQADDGDLYGTTRAGGTDNAGTVFRFGPDGTLTTIFSAAGNPDDLVSPSSLVQAGDGNIYGLGSLIYNRDEYDIKNCIFKLSADGAPSVFDYFYANINYGTGRIPGNVIVRGADGNIYGTSRNYGYPALSSQESGDYVFSIQPPSMEEQILFEFPYIDSGYPAGKTPSTPPVLGADGSFYGTTRDGGANGLGTIYKVAPDKKVTVLHQFAGGSGDGEHPDTLLAQARNGNLYGTTKTGGAGGLGTVYRITPAGVFTVLHEFAGNGDGSSPEAGLIQVNDGFLYGTTSAGGGSDLGTVFKVAPGGRVATTYNFTGVDGDGATPEAPLTQASDGFLYGTTSAGGVNGTGTIFRLAPSTPLPSVDVVATTPRVMLGDGVAGMFTVTLSAAQDHDVTVHYTLAGSASNGTDYVFLKGTKKIKAGKVSKPIMIHPTGDLGGAAKKVVKLIVDADDSYFIGTKGAAKVKIFAGQ